MNNFQKLIRATNILTLWASLPLIGLLGYTYVSIGESMPAIGTNPKLFQLYTLLQNVCAGLIPVFILFIGSYLILDKIKEIKQRSDKDALVGEITLQYNKEINRIIETMSSTEYYDSLSKMVRDSALNVVDEINRKDRLLSPSVCYYKQSSELLQRQKNTFGSTTTYSFMSTSGVNFLNKAVDDIEDSKSLVIKLLLMNPYNEINIEARYHQLKKHEPHKTPYSLKKEIFCSIYNAVSICEKKSKLDIHICLHDDAPLFRFEFTDREAYLSYYLSQESEHNIGPVGVYEPSSKVFSAYKEYFYDVWKRSEEKYGFAINKGKSIKEVRNILLDRFEDSTNGLRDIILSSCNEYCNINERDRCENGCPKN